MKTLAYYCYFTYAASVHLESVKWEVKVDIIYYTFKYLYVQYIMYLISFFKFYFPHI